MHNAVNSSLWIAKEYPSFAKLVKGFGRHNQILVSIINNPSNHEGPALEKPKDNMHLSNVRNKDYQPKLSSQNELEIPEIHIQEVSRTSRLRHPAADPIGNIQSNVKLNRVMQNRNEQSVQSTTITLRLNTSPNSRCWNKQISLNLKSYLRSNGINLQSLRREADLEVRQPSSGTPVYHYLGTLLAVNVYSSSCDAAILVLRADFNLTTKEFRGISEFLKGHCGTSDIYLMYRNCHYPDWIWRKVG